ncbi:hypothetical protein QE363_001735 [Sphingomonas sp. SORGH_AS870]|nr:hypothetical protein [Sphingomonas sp. SORGH_AS_0870]
MYRLKSSTAFMDKAIKDGPPERQRWYRLNRQAAEYQAWKAA